MVTFVVEIPYVANISIRISENDANVAYVLCRRLWLEAGNEDETSSEIDTEGLAENLATKSIPICLVV